MYIVDLHVHCRSTCTYTRTYSATEGLPTVHSHGASNHADQHNMMHIRTHVLYVYVYYAERDASCRVDYSCAVLQQYRHAYPNIARILHLLIVTPATSANVERANPSLKFIKTDLRNTIILYVIEVLSQSPLRKK